MPLTREKCIACRAGSPHVTDEESAELHPQVPDWKLFAEAAGHHPLLMTEQDRSEQPGRPSSAALQMLA